MERDPSDVSEPIDVPDAILAALRHAATDERRAVEYMEAVRWGGTCACPRCGTMRVYAMMEDKTGARNSDYRWRCRDCKRMFTVRTGTVFEASRLPLRVWAFAIWSACSYEQGGSALQISRECGISYKSALHVVRTIREAMSVEPDREYANIGKARARQ